MDEEKEYWKVLSEDRITGDLYSAIVTDGARIHYPLGVWVEPPQYLAKEGYGICIFFDRTSAAIFKTNEQCGGFGHLVMYKVKARGVKTDLPVTLPASCGMKRSFHLALERLSRFGLKHDTKFGWPYGTAMAESIILIKEA